MVHFWQLDWQRIRIYESLMRLGLRELPWLPTEATIHSVEDILRLALTMVDPAVFPMPPYR